MRDGPDLADADYEPSDDAFAQLMRDAFEGLDRARQEDLATMWARIERLEAEARARFRAAWPVP
jgi:hypothetical protein